MAEGEDPPDQVVPDLGLHTPQPPMSREQIGWTAYEQGATPGGNPRGCSPKVLVMVTTIAMLLLLAAVILRRNAGDDASDKSDCAPARSVLLYPAAIGSPMQFWKCGETTTTSEEPSSTEPEEGPGSTAPGSGEGSNAPAPADSDLPPGAVLYQGESGDNIGYIYQDGKSRYLSVEHSGVSTDPGAVQVAWPEAGTITSFGANLGTGDNQGRYGLSVFKVNGQKYTAGCTMEIGQTSCKAEGLENIRLAKGDQVVIIIGEAGNAPARGDYPLDWWFVFQPDA